MSLVIGLPKERGGEHFPVELVKPEALPTNIAWFPFMRGADFHF